MGGSSVSQPLRRSAAWPAWATWAAIALISALVGWAVSTGHRWRPEDDLHDSLLARVRTHLQLKAAADLLRDRAAHLEAEIAWRSGVSDRPDGST